MYRLMEFNLLLLLYFLAFSRKYSILFVAIGLCYTTFFFVDLFFLQAQQLTSFSITLTAAVFILFSVLHFFKLMRDLPSTHIQNLPMFWIDTAVLVYFAGAFFIFLLRNYLIEVMKDDQIVYWSLHNILNIIKNILFAIGLWQATKKPTLNSEKK
jgi:TRAP-type C4-dicarboxylate transport system permease small subunit